MVRRLCLLDTLCTTVFDTLYSSDMKPNVTDDNQELTKMPWKIHTPTIAKPTIAIGLVYLIVLILKDIACYFSGNKRTLQVILGEQWNMPK